MVLPWTNAGVQCSNINVYVPSSLLLLQNHVYPTMLRRAVMVTISVSYFGVPVLNLGPKVFRTYRNMYKFLNLSKQNLGQCQQISYSRFHLHPVPFANIILPRILP
jgi:hypothetical protein